MILATKSIGGDIAHAFHHAAHQVDHGVTHAAHQVAHGVTHAADDVAHGVTHVIHDAGHTAGGVVHHIEHWPSDVMDEIEKEAERHLKALAEAVTKKGLGLIQHLAHTAHNNLDDLAKNRPHLIDDVNSCGFHFGLGPMTCTYANFYKRSTLVCGVLDKAVAKPPALHRQPILDLMTAFGPDTVDFGVSAEFALVVGTNILSVSGGLDAMPFSLAVYGTDKLLASIGVPK